MGVPAYVDAMLNVAPGHALGGRRTTSEIEDPLFPQEHELVRWWLRVMQESQTPFQEVLAFFWHDHFAASHDNLDGERDALDGATRSTSGATSGNGNLRTLLLDDGARPRRCSTWLDGVLNTRQRARTRTSRASSGSCSRSASTTATRRRTSSQAAKAFTGYRTRFNDATRPVASSSSTRRRHDTGAKTFFGQTIAGRRTRRDDYQRDRRHHASTTGRSPSSSRRSCSSTSATRARRRRSSTRWPRLLRGASYELQPVLQHALQVRGVLLARARKRRHRRRARSSTSSVGVPCRATGRACTDPVDARRTRSLDTARPAQRPTQPPSVNGWPIGALWLSAQNMLDRANGVRDCITHRDDQDGSRASTSRRLLARRRSATAPNVVDALATCST